MNILERIGFQWVLAWVLMETIAPGSSHKEKIQVGIIVTLSMSYYYGVHTVIYQKIKSLFKPA